MLENGLQYYIKKNLGIDAKRVTTQNNQCYVTGRLGDNFKFSYNINDEKVYSNTIKMTRFSEIIDEIPIAISEKIHQEIDLVAGKCKDLKVAIVGVYHSYTKTGANGDAHIKSYLWVKYMEIIPETEANPVDENNIYMEGFICKPVVCRKTLRRRKIADVFVAVNRPHRKTDYIPCITWSDRATFAGSLSVGDKVRIIGRLQNREEKLKDQEPDSTGKVKVKIHYEVAISDLEKVE